MKAHFFNILYFLSKTSLKYYLWHFVVMLIKVTYGYIWSTIHTFLDHIVCNTYICDNVFIIFPKRSKVKLKYLEHWKAIPGTIPRRHSCRRILYLLCHSCMGMTMSKTMQAVTSMGHIFERNFVEAAIEFCAHPRVLARLKVVRFANIDTLAQRHTK